MSRTPLPLLTLGVLALACSGEQTTGGSPPPLPPPVPPTPSALVVIAGDLQTGEPGDTLLLRPAVQVRDAQGRGLVGIAVSFAVDSGGGTISEATPVTGQDGVARSGSWRLGPSEGSNRLKVTVGSLGPAYLRATGAYATTTVADVQVGTGGRTIRFTQSGHPLSGFELRIPGGAYRQSHHWTLSAATVRNLPGRPALTPITPVVIISTDADYADSLLVLRFPVRVPANQFAMAFMHDPASGVIEPLLLLARDSLSVTVGSRHLNPGALLRAGAPGPAAGSAVSLSSGALWVFLLGADYSTVDGTQDSGFRPGTDDWEFTNWGSYLEPGGHCAGQSISALYYYFVQKPSLGPLFGKYDRTRIWPDNPRGYRFASVTQRDMNWANAVQFLQQMNSVGPTLGVALDSLQFYALAYAINVTGQPQLLSIWDNVTTNSAHAIIGYRTSSGVVSVADPNFPGTIRSVDFSSGTFRPYPSQPNAGAASVNYNVIQFVGTSALVPATLLDTRWQEFQAGTIGQGDFPAHQIEQYDPISDTWAPAGSPIRTTTRNLLLRAMCPGCVNSYGGGRQLLGIVDSAGNLNESVQSNGTSTTLPSGSHTVGFKVFAVDPTVPGATSPLTWLDFQWATVQSSPFFITPDTLRGAFGATDTLTSHPGAVRPAQARYVWDFGDGAPLVTRQNDSVVSHVYTGMVGADTARLNPDIPHFYRPKLKLYDAANSQLVGTAAGLVVKQEGVRWRLTQFDFVGETGQPFSLPTHPLNFINAEIPDFLDPIVATPRNAFLVWLPPGSMRYLAAHPNYASPAWGWFTPPTTGASVHLHWEPAGLAMRAATLHRPLAVADPAVFLNAYWAQAARPLDIQDSLGLTGTLQAGRLKGRGLYFAQQAFHQDRWSPAQLLYLVDASFQADTVSGTVQLRRRLIVMNGHNPHRDTLAVFGDRTRTYQFRGIREKP